MQVDPFGLTQYDRQPYYPGKVKDSAGELVDLTSATIVCNMRLKASPKTLVINRQSIGIVILNQTTNKGEFTYAWQATETDTPGDYHIAFEITPTGGGGKFTFPNPTQGRALVKIQVGLDAE